MDINNYALNLKKVNKIKNLDDKNQIHNYYRDMIGYYDEGRTKLSDNIFQTLNRSGYLIDIQSADRDNKLKKIV